MKAHDAIKLTIGTADHIVEGYLADLSDADMLRRPAPDCNHINWQVGHCIAGEHAMISKVFPGALPPLPEGFAARYTSENAKKDDAASFCSKEELLAVHKKQRAATLKALAERSEAELDTPVEGWTPNVGALFAGAAGSHWLMHVGQWAVVRRQLGRPPLF